jgi:hypothetical protein
VQTNVDRTDAVSTAIPVQALPVGPESIPSPQVAWAAAPLGSHIPDLPPHAVGQNDAPRLIQANSTGYATLALISKRAHEVQARAFLLHQPVHISASIDVLNRHGKLGNPGEQGLRGRPGATGEPGTVGQPGGPGKTGHAGGPGTRGEDGTAGLHAGPQDLFLSGDASTMQLRSDSGTATLDMGATGILFVDAQGGDGGSLVWLVISYLLGPRFSSSRPSGRSA